MQALAVFALGARSAVQRAGLRPVRNIFVEARFGLLLGEQERTVVSREIKWNTAEEKNFSGFKLAAVFLAAL